MAGRTNVAGMQRSGMVLEVKRDDGVRLSAGQVLQRQRASADVKQKELKVDRQSDLNVGPEADVPLRNWAN